MKSFHQHSTPNTVYLHVFAPKIALGPTATVFPPVVTKKATRFHCHLNDCSSLPG